MVGGGDKETHEAAVVSASLENSNGTISGARGQEKDNPGVRHAQPASAGATDERSTAANEASSALDDGASAPADRPSSDDATSVQAGGGSFDSISIVQAVSSKPALAVSEPDVLRSAQPIVAARAPIPAPAVPQPPGEMLIFANAGSLFPHSQSLTFRAAGSQVAPSLPPAPDPQASVDGDAHLTQEEKTRQRRMLRNRESAARSRDKRKQRNATLEASIAKLKGRAQTLDSLYEELAASVKAMRERIEKGVES